MPIEFSTCLERDLLYARWYGRVDFDQFAQNFMNYVADEYYRPGRRELIDHSGIDEFDIDFNLVRSILRQVNAQDPTNQVTTHTVIYSPDETIYGMGRMYQTLSEMAQGIRVEVFRTEREALDALGLEHSSIAALRSAEVFLPARLKDN
ncbi:hypothetical protein V8J82_20195 [Gymnodinialimonas sp. 2305UL16-5]|uniref:hypothetical protein n=1 Tax=Gymnodinialimonas mytili TaxID=3126503 RepID=UPI0030A8096E